ncbi:MAG: beta-propeller fold lactonase family protein [Candidatus Cybelea sp.]
MKRPLAIDPTDKFVYVTNDGTSSNNVSAYTVDATSGALTPVVGSPFGAGTGPVGVAVDPKGKFVYEANAQSNNIYGYSIDARSGALTPVAGSPFAAGDNPEIIVTCRLVGSTCKPPPM